MSIPAQGAVGADTMTIDHEFKSHPDVFWPAARGEKTFEYRRDDRGGYEIGQTVRLRCYDPARGYHDAAPLDRRITNILRGGEFELPQGYCILSLAPLASPRADSGERTAGEVLNDRLRAAGMFTIPEMMGETPLTRWEVHAGMMDLDFFEQWLEAQVRQYLHLKARYDLGDKNESDELYEWTLAHVGAFRAILVNFKAARKATPAQPAGAVPDGLRALLDAGRVLLAAEQAEAEAEAHVQRATAESEEAVKAGTLKNFVAMRAASDLRMKALRQRQAAQDAVRKALGEALSTHPAGQSAGSGAEDASRDFQMMLARIANRYTKGLDISATVAAARDLLKRKGTLSPFRDTPAPDSTRTGQGEAEGLPSLWEPQSPAEWLEKAERHRRKGMNLGVLHDELPRLIAVFEKALAARPAAPEAQGLERVRHVKRGTEYEVLGEAEAQISNGAPAQGKPGNVRFLREGDRLIVYRGSDNKLWCRFADEFNRRFVPAPPVSSGQGGR